jgi:hypothetical protein
MYTAPALLILLAATTIPAGSQERVNPSGLARADLVVVGTLHRDFKFPWLDGWNERGHIQVERVLKGNSQSGQNLPFAWARDFRQGWSLTRPDWRGQAGRRGIWLLSREGGRYRANDLFGGFLGESEYLPEVLRILADDARR